MTLEQISIGDVAIAGRYRVRELLGQGGFAKVYRGEQQTTGQEVAIKLLELEYADSAATMEIQVERFRREARFCAELHHPNIVPLIDSGETSDGRVFAVFSLVPGQHLGNVLLAEGSLDPAEALHLMTQVMDALGCAHAKSILHRDLKPGNIMVCSSGARRNAQVLDFGIGTFTSERRAREVRHVTERGEYLGTPAYSAPEQLRGGPPSLRSDLYAWGLILLECLTGRSPLGATRPHEIIHRQLSPDPIRIPMALQGTELGEILRKATEKDVEKRQTTAAELLAALQRILASRLPTRDAILGRLGESARMVQASPSSPSALSPTWLVPVGRNPNFTGRDDVLQSMGDALRTSRLLAVVALHGLGGIGKTQLALEYAYRHADQYRLVAWIRAEEPETLAADYGAIAAAVHLSETPYQRQRIEAVRSWLEQNDRWLLVFDNAPNATAIRDFLPRSHAGHILVTSRDQTWRNLAASVAVDVLDRPAAIELVLKRTGETDEAKALELCDELGRLPLALEEAAAYIEATGRSIEGYLDLLRAQRQRVLFGDTGAGGHGATLRTTWELSFRLVEQRMSIASDLLKVSSFLAPEDIPFSLFRGRSLPAPLGALSDEMVFDACMATLRQFSLIKTESDAFSIHRLVQLATRERLSGIERERWAWLSLELLAGAYPSNTVAGAEAVQARRLLPHALAALSHAEPHEVRPELAAEMFRRTGGYMSTQSLHEAADQLERALALLEKTARPEPMQLAMTLWELGTVCYSFGKSTKAREDEERALQILESLDSPRAALLRPYVQIHLGWVLRTMGDFEGALALAERRLETVRPDPGASAASLALMARVHWSMNHMSDARACLREARTLINQVERPYPLTSATWYALAQVSFDFGYYDEALACAERGYEIAIQGYGRDQPLTCLNVCARGSTHLRRGELTAARDWLERALDGGLRHCHYLHEDIAIARSELAECLRLLGDFDGAQAHLVHALESLPDLCGHTARVEGHARTILGALLRDKRDLSSATDECQKGLRVIEAKFGKSHPLRMPALNVLGRVLADEGQLLEAADKLLESIAIAEAAELHGHPDYGEALEGLGMVRAHQGNESAARLEFGRAQQIFRESLGAGHAATIRVSRRLAEVRG